MASPTNDQGKKKGRLGRLFGGKKDDNVVPVRPTSDEQPSSSSNMVDSAYASSDNERKLSNTNSRPDVVPFENRGQISGVNEDRNLTVNKSTGDVMDKETGEVVSTVTTTTTTTTTTISRAGGQKNQTVEVSTQRGDSPAEMPGDGPGTQSNMVSSTVRSTPQPQPQSSDSISNPAAIPTAGGVPVGQRNTEERLRDRDDSLGNTPNVPQRHPHRKSRENFDPSPPPQQWQDQNANQHNFSYPSRDRLREQSQAQPVSPVYGHEGQQRGSTLGNLKAAAVGLHGVGETLRGTLNSEIDNRYPRKNPTKNAVVQQKNQATMEAGQREMAGLRERTGLQSTYRT